MGNVDMPESLVGTGFDILSFKEKNTLGVKY